MKRKCPARVALELVPGLDEKRRGENGVRFKIGPGNEFRDRRSIVDEHARNGLKVVEGRGNKLKRTHRSLSEKRRKKRAIARLSD